jgi:hypothetical protein
VELSVEQSTKIRPPPRAKRFATFQEWIGDRAIQWVGTNTGASELPFQGWRRFKEAFAPELVHRAIKESEIGVSRCIDPFGGSGTTALACQFLGVHCCTIEVNPYLADLIEAKLVPYNTLALSRCFAWLRSHVNHIDPGPELRALQLEAPATFMEPGVNNNFIFFEPILRRLLAYRRAIESLRDPAIRRLFRVLLGATAIPTSNVTVSGKGRRYRGSWRGRQLGPNAVDDVFHAFVKMALSDIERFGRRATHKYTMLRGDARHLVNRVGKIDLAVFSPPYPNSADYTDIYNVELWTMGYLRDWNENVTLRRNTLSSHVQLKRKYLPPPNGSSILNDVLSDLEHRRSLLWHRDIPAMIGAYFADISVILAGLYLRLNSRAAAYIVLGDSRYAEVTIPTAAIVTDCARKLGFYVESAEPFRSMRVAPQQGGRPELAETLVIFRR